MTMHVYSTNVVMYVNKWLLFTYITGSQVTGFSWFVTLKGHLGGDVHSLSVKLLVLFKYNIFPIISLFFFLHHISAVSFSFSQHFRQPNTHSSCPDCVEMIRALDNALIIWKYQKPCHLR